MQIHCLIERLTSRFSSFDPRLYQIASLGTLLIFGLLWRHFDVSLRQLVVTLATTLVTQYAGTRWHKLPSFDPLSPLVSALGLCIFLRTNDLSVVALASFLAIASKFIIRWKGKHLFNPTNFALVVVLASGLGWISAGQWGQVAWFALLIACLGSLVVTRAARADVTLSFLGFYVGLLITRALWLGDPLTISLHQIESGTLLIFSFFMITDPKTTPDSRTGRILFTFMVAVAALSVQFVLYRPNGPLWGLIACSPIVPLLDRLLPGSRYDWSDRMLKNPASGVLTSLRPSTYSGGHLRQSTYPLACDRSERLKRSLVCTSSALRSLRPCRTDFLSILQAFLLCRRWQPSKLRRPKPSSDHISLSPNDSGSVSPIPSPTKEVLMTRSLVLVLTLLIGLFLWSGSASAFCGFYVAKADTKLFNKASEVAIVRHDDKTVITMANDFKGDVKEFAMVVPVPTLLDKEQIHIGDAAVLKHLADYSAPRLVEYFDQNPCMRYDKMEQKSGALKNMAPASEASRARDRALGVTVEAQYTVGEYDILILSAKESAGLETWLTENGYRIPSGASAVLHSYLKQGLKFFVAKVNLGEQAKLGLTHLRPLQIAFESPRFVLPIRLGTVNADGAQELFIYFLTKNGRVETTNYRTIRLPEAQEIPIYVKDRFGDFYRDLFSQQVRRENERGVFLEYAWDMNWCDPCAANPLSAEELRGVGVFWQEQGGAAGRGMGQAQNVYLTRLHVRYDQAHFPEDLIFQETSDRANFQARYILRHPWTGTEDCPAATAYRQQLLERYEREAQTLATLTGWNIGDIRKSMNLSALPTNDGKKWYQRLWNN